MQLKSFIYYSTILSIFTEAYVYTIGFDIKLFYPIILINTIILIAFNKFIYSKGLLIFHSIILLTGLYSCVFGYNRAGYFLVQLIALLIIPTYYLSFFSFFRYKFEDSIRFYCKCCMVLAIIGFLRLPSDISVGRALHSLLLEPAHYCAVVLPAFFITLKDRRFPRYYFILILLSIIVSGSSLGYIGLGVAMMLYAKKISFWKTAFTFIIVCALGIAVYISYVPFQLRTDDTINGITNRDLANANLSTYAFLSNLFVSTQSFLSNPLVGNGIGSHTVSRSLYLKNVEGIEVFEKMDMDHLNAQDAGSLLSRLMSEVGLVGIIGVFYFIGKFYVSNKDDAVTFNAIVSKGILIYFFAKLFREGHYFSPEMYFFVLAYWYNYKTSNQKLAFHTTNKLEASL